MTGSPLSRRTATVFDLFAGPGGWDMGVREVGIDPIGFEWDDAACQTRRAVGLKTMQCDVAEVDFESGWQDTRLWGLIASPPCQAWSMAGKGGGQRDKQHVVACALELAAGNDTRAHHAEQCEDPRSILVVEPLRWALHFRPRWIAFEQVPPVLELWTLFAQILSDLGYSTWAGVLEAERYGVPQTRERAILMGSLDGPVEPPRPTHQRYVKGEPPRHDVTFEGEVLPWVSMAQALGWDEGSRPRPAPTVTGGGTEHGGVEVFASKSSRQSVSEAVNRPAPTITTTRRSEDGLLVGRQLPEGEGKEVGGWKFRNGSQDNACARDPEEPAGTLFFGHQLNSVGWVRTNNFSAIACDPDGKRSKNGSVPYERPAEDPSPTLDTHVQSWTVDRPSTTLAGDPRVFPPGGHMANDGRDNSKMVGRSEDAIRVSVEEASILQTFPPDYPWQGSRTKQFEQIGNAVPPMLAGAVLRALVGAVVEERKAA
jgi:DNA (cytosine-5)-methyltransferase 1